jgi:hypothetical protein
MRTSNRIRGPRAKEGDLAEITVLEQGIEQFQTLVMAKIRKE